MDQRDQKLLDKQMRAIHAAPRNDGIMVLALLAMFFTGMTFGGFLFAYKSEPVQFASNDAIPTMTMPNGAPVTARP